MFCVDLLLSSVLHSVLFDFVCVVFVVVAVAAAFTVVVSVEVALANAAACAARVCFLSQSLFCEYECLLDTVYSANTCNIKVWSSPAVCGSTPWR